MNYNCIEKSASKNGCFVDDIIPKDVSKLKICFVLESPHNEEIKFKYPLAGQSGKTVMKKLVEKSSDKSFGNYLKNDNLLNKKIAVVNVVNIPLQNTENCDVNTDLSFIRRNYKSVLKHRCQKYNQLEKCIINNFNHRIKDINNSCLFVLCGKFAETYFNKTSKKQCDKICIPHPSRNQWNNIKLSSAFCSIAKKIKKIKEQTAKENEYVCQ